MYYNNKKLILSILWIVLGVALIAGSVSGYLESPYFSGFGAGFLVVGIAQVIRNIRYRNDPEYREKVDVACDDERNRYIRMKAWAWAGYIFIFASGCASLILNILGYKDISIIVSYALCFMLAVYYICYLIIQKKE